MLSIKRPLWVCDANSYRCSSEAASKALFVESHDALGHETEIFDVVSADFEVVGGAPDDVVATFERHAGLVEV